MNLLDRFSTHLRDVLARAIQLAGELRNPEVEPTHLLFCLFSQRGSVGQEVLQRYKLTSKALERAILDLPTLPVGHEEKNSTLQAALTPLSSATKAVLEKAMILAQERDHTFIGTEHLLTAVIDLQNAAVMHALRTSEVKIDELRNQLDVILTNTGQFPKGSDVKDMVDKLQDSMDQHTHDHDHDQGEMFDMGEMPMEPKAKRGKKESALDFFASHLTSEEAQKNIDPVIGRDSEVERVIQILCRRTKNNPLLLGEPGVGKTAIVEGLAKRILQGKVPDLLLNKKIYSLDMGLLIAGTIYRGEFEARIRQVIDEVSQNPNIIVFIDEIHNIVGAGSNQGTMDAANILKPALSRGRIRCIGATTAPEYKKYIENDAALERRFQPVYVKEPSLADTVKILEGIKDNYEAYHRVDITTEAVQAAVRLSDRYITNKFLPDKAIDLIDETAAAKRLKAKTAAWQTKLWRLEQQLEKTILAKERAASTDKFTEAVNLKKREAVLRTEIKKLTEQRHHKKVTKIGTVTGRDVVEQVSIIIGTPTSELLLSEGDELHKLEERLKEYVVGQDQVVAQVARLMRQARLGLSSAERPLASFMFVGESGVGKTELAKALARVLYHDKDALIKLDMSEFNESFGVSKLLGSPAGYVGYKESNQFTDKIKMHPHCVVLFDEIDKAHKDVVRLLLQMLENGEITDAGGKKISLRHATIILTTSFAADEAKRGSIGFGHGTNQQTDTMQKLMERLKEHFSVEIINRLDQICLFNPLDEKALARIAELELGKLNERLSEHRTRVKPGTDVWQWVLAQLGNKNANAREIRRYVRSTIEALVTEAILEKKVKSEFTLAVNKEKLTIK